MERSPEWQKQKIETVPVPLHRMEQVIEPLLVTEELYRTEEERNRIRLIKERLLEHGVMTIEPLKGDPFVLSREHQAANRGVTDYLPDGTVQKTSFEDYRARLATGRRAARLFEQVPQTHSDVRQTVSKRFLAKAFERLKRRLGTIWSKLWR